MLSHGLWHRRFGSDRGNPSLTIRLNQHHVTLVGVTAEGFTGSAGAASDFYGLLHMGKALFNPELRARFRVDDPNANQQNDSPPGPGGGSGAGGHMGQSSVPADFGGNSSPQAGGPLGPRISTGAGAIACACAGGHASSRESALGHDLRTPLLL